MHEVVELQTADLLAWEVNLQRVNQFRPDPAPPRDNLARLAALPRCWFIHSPESLGTGVLRLGGCAPMNSSAPSVEQPRDLGERPNVIADPRRHRGGAGVGVRERLVNAPEVHVQEVQGNRRRVVGDLLRSNRRAKDPGSQRRGDRPRPGGWRGLSPDPPSLRLTGSIEPCVRFKVG